MSTYKKYGFTLIELSIVLVIIGLVVGGILVGKDLIESATVRSQIAQIENYKITVNNFKLKYNYLPGDITNSHAVASGFFRRVNCKGYGNGDDLIHGLNNINQPCEDIQVGYDGNGEVVLFWMDLNRSGMIGGRFNAFDSTNEFFSFNTTGRTENCYPRAVIGGSNFVSVWSGGYGHYPGYNRMGGNRKNYLSISTMPEVLPNNYCQDAARTQTMGLTVKQAHDMDTKLDDGLPQSGTVIAMYPAFPSAYWAAGGGQLGASGSNCCAGNADYNAPTTSATGHQSTNCYDNAGSAGARQNYSTRRNSNLRNCAISFELK